MAGIPSISIKSMLANPALIPTLPRGAEVRCQERVPESTRGPVDERMRDLWRKAFNEDSLHVIMGRVLLKTCQLDSSYRRLDQVQSPEYQQIMKLAREVGLSENEVPFIQYHEIGARRYVLIGDHHNDARFNRLFSKIGVSACNKEFAIFREAVCQDGRSSIDFCRFVATGEEVAATGPWIFGLEGEERPLIASAKFVRELQNLVLKSETNLVDATPIEAAIAARTEERLSRAYWFAAFLDELHFNTPWEKVINKGTEEHFTPQAWKLLQDILEVVGTSTGLEDKQSKLYPPLFENSPNVWKDLFLGLTMICLKIPSIRERFYPSELATIKEMICKPKDEDVWTQFCLKILFDVRDRSFANALFTRELPQGTVRVAYCGFSHLPGVIRELERLAAAARKV